MNHVSTQPVAHATFREFVHRLRRDRRYFLEVDTAFGEYPQYYDAVEWPFRELVFSQSASYDPGRLASRLALAYFCMRRALDRPLLTPESGKFDRLIAGWRNPKKPVEDQNYLGFWQTVRSSLETTEPGLAPAIEQFVENEPELTLHDRYLVLFALALFFRLVLETRREFEDSLKSLIWV